MNSTLADAQPIAMPACDQRDSGHPGAMAGASSAGFYRGNPNIQASKSGIQKRIDRLIRERGENQRHIDMLQCEVNRQAMEIDDLRATNHKLETALARCVNALKRRRVNGQ